MPKVEILPVLKDSDGWCITLGIAEFLDVIHHPVFQKEQMFWKLDLFPS
jgi:hypothetical protein